MFEIWMMVE